MYEYQSHDVSDSSRRLELPMINRLYCNSLEVFFEYVFFNQFYSFFFEGENIKWDKCWLNCTEYVPYPTSYRLNKYRLTVDLILLLIWISYAWHVLEKKNYNIGYQWTSCSICPLPLKWNHAIEKRNSPYNYQIT